MITNITSKCGGGGAKPKTKPAGQPTATKMAVLTSAGSFPQFAQTLVLSDLLQSSPTMPAGTTTVPTLAAISTGKHGGDASGCDNKTAKLFALKSTAVSPLNTATMVKTLPNGEIKAAMVTTGASTNTVAMPMAPNLSNNLPLGSVIQLTQISAAPHSAMISRSHPVTGKQTVIKPKLAVGNGSCKATVDGSGVGITKPKAKLDNKAKPNRTTGPTGTNTNAAITDTMTDVMTPINLVASSGQSMQLVSNLIPSTYMGQLQLPTRTVTSIASNGSTAIPVVVSTSNNGSSIVSTGAGQPSLLPISSSIVTTKNGGQIAVLWVPSQNGKQPTIGLAGNQQLQFMPMQLPPNMTLASANQAVPTSARQLTQLQGIVMHGNQTVPVTMSGVTTSTAPTVSKIEPKPSAQKATVTNIKHEVDSFFSLTNSSSSQNVSSGQTQANNSVINSVSTANITVTAPSHVSLTSANITKIMQDFGQPLIPPPRSSKKKVNSVEVATQTDADRATVNGDTITVNQISLGGDRIELMFTSSAPPAIGSDLVMTPSPSLVRSNTRNGQQGSVESPVGSTSSVDSAIGESFCADSVNVDSMSTSSSSSGISSAAVSTSSPGTSLGSLSESESQSLNLMDELMGTEHNVLLLNGMDSNLNTSATSNLEMYNMGNVQGINCAVSHGSYEQTTIVGQNNLLFNSTDPMLSNAVISPVSVNSPDNQQHSMSDSNVSDSMDIGNEARNALNAINNHYSELVAEYAGQNMDYILKPEDYTFELLYHLLESERIKHEDFPIHDVAMVNRVLFNLETEKLDFVTAQIHQMQQLQQLQQLQQMQMQLQQPTQQEPVIALKRPLDESVGLVGAVIHVGPTVSSATVLDGASSPLMINTMANKRVRTNSKQPVSPLSMAILGAIETTTKSLANCGISANTTPMLNGLLMSTGPIGGCSSPTLQAHLSSHILSRPSTLSSSNFAPFGNSIQSYVPEPAINNNSLLKSILTAPIVSTPVMGTSSSVLQQTLESIKVPSTASSTIASPANKTNKAPAKPRPPRQRPPRPKKPKQPNNLVAVSSVVANMLQMSAATSPKSNKEQKSPLAAKLPANNVNSVASKELTKPKAPSRPRSRKKPSTIAVSSIMSTLMASGNAIDTNQITNTLTNTIVTFTMPSTMPTTTTSSSMAFSD